MQEQLPKMLFNFLWYTIQETF